MDSKHRHAARQGLGSLGGWGGATAKNGRVSDTLSAEIMSAWNTYDGALCVPDGASTVGTCPVDMSVSDVEFLTDVQPWLACKTTNWSHEHM